MKFVFTELYTDKGPHQDTVRKLQQERFGSVALPLYVVLSPDGTELGRLTGTLSLDQFLTFLKGFDGGK